MPTTPNMGLVLPDEDGSANVWDTLLNAVFGFSGGGIDGHDHTTGKGVKVPSAGLNINADLAFASGGVQYAITQLKALDFTPAAAAGMSGYQGALFVNSADNELYWRTTAGVNVQLTLGSSLNASIIGGIGGDYASVGALLEFTDGSDVYSFRQQVGAAVRQYGKIASADVQLFEYIAHPAAGVPTNSVRLKSPAALAASYDVTFPAAVPAQNRPLYMLTTGVLSHSVDEVLNVAPYGGAGDGAVFAVAGTTRYIAGSAGTEWNMPLPLLVGSRIKSVTWYYQVGAGTLTFALRNKVLTAVADGDIGTPPTDNAVTGLFATITQSAINYTVPSTEQVYLQWRYSATSANNKLHAIRVTFDRGA